MAEVAGSIRQAGSHRASPQAASLERTVSQRTENFPGAGTLSSSSSSRKPKSLTEGEWSASQMDLSV